MSDGNHCIPSGPENPKIPRDPHGFTPSEALVRALIEQSLRRLRRIHNLLLRTGRRLPPTPPGELARMKRHEIPFSVSARLRLDLKDATELCLAEAITILEDTLQDTPQRLLHVWRRWQEPTR